MATLEANSDRMIEKATNYHITRKIESIRLQVSRYLKNCGCRVLGGYYGNFVVTVCLARSLRVQERLGKFCHESDKGKEDSYIH